MILKTAQFLALLLTGLASGIAVAHVLELPNKLPLSAAEYLLVQQHIYNGWGRVVGPMELVALLAAIVVAILLRRRRVPMLFTLVAVACLTLAQVVWQLHNGPVNQAVDTWTVTTLPSDWQTYRNRWEYAHAVRAGLNTIALSALILEVLTEISTSRRANSLTREKHHSVT